MPRLTDPDRLAAYRDALKNWAVTGCIEFLLREDAARYLRELGVKQRDLGRLMFQYVEAGGEIDEVREVGEYEYEFHYDLRFTINDRRVYIETRLKYRPPFKPLDPTIHVVNVHDK